MNTKILIGIIIFGVVVIFGGIFVFWYIPTHQCPQSCDDKNVCTEDFCSSETKYKCQQIFLSDCCGNTKCDSKETYETCPADCPNCDDNNQCTKDSFDYHTQKCLNAPVLDVICCGNTICEIGETYTNCARDCPNCDDENKCTKDSYDYYQRKCVNKVIIPCCGNGICDKGAETRSNCSTDCPSCDDNNRLTSDSFNYTTQKCENIVTYYFIDDFESGAQNWNYGPTPEDPTASWSTKIEGNNTVFRGTGHNWADLSGKKWTDYILKVKFKIIKGDIHFNYRVTQGEKGPDRYFIGIYGSNQLVLNKQISESFFNDLARWDGTLAPGWHTIEIRGYNNVLNIYIDNNLSIKYKDTKNPILSGGVGFETLDNSEFLIDNVEIKIIAPTDVTYP